MTNIPSLKEEFEQIIKLKNKAPINSSQFCSELIKSDDDEYLEFHFSLLVQKKRYVQSDLKIYFAFRQNREKVHHFLHNKLKNLTDDQLINDVTEILEDINYCSLEEFKEWIADLQSGKRKDKDKFVYSIRESPFVNYHYELLNAPKLDKDFKRNLLNSFDYHKEDGELVLLSKLDNNEDVDFHAEIIFLLGSIDSKYKSRTLEYARKFAESTNDYMRDRAIIVLGWIGTGDDIKIFEKHLLYDTNAECRAWSAASFMQMWLKRKSKSLKRKAFEAYSEAFQNESDYFVLSIILSSIREIGETRLGISQSSLDELSTSKIDEAKTKAIRFLDKALKTDF